MESERSTVASPAEGQGKKSSGCNLQSLKPLTKAISFEVARAADNLHNFLEPLPLASRGPSDCDSSVIRVGRTEMFLPTC